jgi:predicted anti-sigma-YlaC factor YlaD
MLMDCKAVQRAIYRFVYGEGDEHELVEMRNHLDRCKECREEQALIDSILAKLHAHATEERCACLPDGCRERMLDGIRRNIGSELRAG